ncbi:MAG: DUF3987 domain-containing protein [Prevotella sp.]|nr:DUF3987 domain-containing protein [Prevotella sp.]
MSCYSIVYRDGKKFAVPVNSREEFLAIRNHSLNLANLSLARKGNKSAKGRLAQFNYSLMTPSSPAGILPRDGEEEVSNSFPLKNAHGVGNSVGMDVDHIEDVKPVIERILEQKDRIGLLMMERSASGNGLHIVFRRNYALDQVENIKAVADVIGVEPDMGAKDITRVFFASSGSETDLLFLDDELFENAPPTPVPSPMEGEGRENSNDSEKTKTTDSARQESGGVGVSSYLGIPYSDIIDKWWEMYHNGQTPVVSNRDTLTYELAVNLRHICGFDEALMDKVIPCYDGFPQEQKLKCIRSAIEAKRTQMPRKLRELLEALTSSNVTNLDMLDTIDRIKDEDDAMYGRMLPTMPMGIRDCMEANGDALAMPTLLVSCACIGALATNVKLKVHHKARGLNIYPFVCGEFASGKGQMDPVFEEWTRDLQKDADECYEKEDEWRRKAVTKKSGTTEAEPKLPVRMLPLNNTLANIAERLGNVKGKHAISFTPEADMVFSKWRGCMTDFTVMVRIAYDEARFDREAKSAEAVRVHIPNLLWNVIMCGTQDSLYRLVTNVTDGFLSRICLCKTPDNTWERYQDRDTNFTDIQRHNIQMMSRMLSLAEGTMEGEELEELGKAWLEEIRILSMKSWDKVLARQRFRGCINSQRVSGAILLCKCLEKLYNDCGNDIDKAERELKRSPRCWMRYIDECFENQYMDQVFQVVTDAMLDITLYFFRERLAEAYADKDYAKVTSAPVKSKSANSTVYDLLPTEFTFEQAMSQAIDVKGVNISANNVSQMLKNWKNHGLVEYLGSKRYTKNLSSVNLSKCQGGNFS